MTGQASRGAHTVKTVPLNSDHGQYLNLIAVVGRCTCATTDGCTEEPRADSTTRHCRLCLMLDPEWLCPRDEDADYPDPDQVTIEGSIEATRAEEPTP